MGFTKKSWLALALAVLMVFGVAVSAFAESATEVIEKGFDDFRRIEFIQATSGRNEVHDDGHGNAHVTLGAWQKPITVEMTGYYPRGLRSEGNDVDLKPSGDDSVGEEIKVWFLKSELDSDQQKVYSEFTPENFTLKANKVGDNFDGTFTITPTGLTKTAEEFWVVVGPKGEYNWNFANQLRFNSITQGIMWFRGKFSVNVKPSIEVQGGKDSIYIDLNEANDKMSSTITFTAPNYPDMQLVMESEHDITYYDRNKNVVADWDDTSRMKVTKSSNTYIFAADFAGPHTTIPGEGYVGFKGYLVDDAGQRYEVAEYLVPYKVEDTRTTTAIRPHHITLTPPAQTLNRNDFEEDFTFKVRFYDVNNKELNPDNFGTEFPLFNLNNVTVEAINPAGKDVIVEAGPYAPYYDATDSTIHWKHGSDPSGSAKIWVEFRGLLGAEATVNVNAIPTTATPNPLTLNLNSKDGKTTDEVTIRTPQISGGYVEVEELIDGYGEISVDVDGVVDIDRLPNGKLQVEGLKVGEATVTLSGFYHANNNHEIDYPLPDVSFKVKVIDTTVHPAITVSKETVTLDIAGEGDFEHVHEDITVTPPTGTKFDTDEVYVKYADDAREDLLESDFDVRAKSEWAAALFTVQNAKSFPNRGKLGTTTLNVYGYINHVKTLVKTITVNVINTGTNVVNQIVTENKTVTIPVTTVNFSERFDLLDSNGAKIAQDKITSGLIVTITPFNNITKPVVALTDGFTIGVGGLIPTTNNRLVRLTTTGATGSSLVTISDPSGRVPSTSFTVVVEPVTFTASPNPVQIDITDPTKVTQTVKLTAVGNAKLGRTSITIDDANVASATIEYDDTITVKGLNPGVTTMSVKSYVDTEFRIFRVVNVAIEVTNGEPIKTDVINATMNLDLKVGGKNRDSFKVWSNPEDYLDFYNITATSADTKIATVADIGWKAIGDDYREYQVEAVSVGTTTVTIKAPISGSHLGKFVTYVITVNVTDTTPLPTFNVNASATGLEFLYKDNAYTPAKEVLTVSPAVAGDVITDITMVSENSLVAYVSDQATFDVIPQGIGTTRIKIDAKVNGKQAQTVYVNVTVKAVENPTKLVGFVLDPREEGRQMVLTTTKAAPNAIKFTNNPKHTISFYDASGLKQPIINAVNGSAKKIKNVTIQEGNVHFELIGTGLHKITVYNAAGQANVIYFQISTQTLNAISFANPVVTLKVGQRVDIDDVGFVYSPADARYQGISSSSSNTKVARTNGKKIILGAAVGSTSVKFRSSHYSLSKIPYVYLQVNVVADYTGINYRTAMLGSDNGYRNPLSAIFAKAQFTGGTTVAPATLSATTKAGLATELAALSAGMKATDIFTFYYSGTTTGSAIQVGAELVTFDELAAILAKNVPATIFCILDCNSSSLIINNKAIQNANAAFAKAATLEKNLTDSQLTGTETRFKVLTATSLKKQTVSGGNLLSKHIALALTSNDSGIITGSGTNMITLQRLYTAIASSVKAEAKQSGSNQQVGVYPADNAYPVYAVQK